RQQRPQWPQQWLLHNIGLAGSGPLAVTYSLPETLASPSPSTPCGRLPGWPGGAAEAAPVRSLAL
ncbi:hypothetical protein HaLaN_21373, partial [Haematococcus lacustris]